jgi:Protein of unknown function (DUF2587)
MTEPSTQPSGQSGSTQPDEDPRVIIVGPGGMAVEGPPANTDNDADQDNDGQSVADLVEQPAKVMRVGSMIKQLLEEVRAAPLDEASRVRLREIHQSSIKELEKGLAPELVQELERLSLPFGEGSVPSEAELRVAQAQLVGWLEGLFHGIQTALFAGRCRAGQGWRNRNLAPTISHAPGLRLGSISDPRPPRREPPAATDRHLGSPRDRRHGRGRSGVGKRPAGLR